MIRLATRATQGDRSPLLTDPKVFAPIKMLGVLGVTYAPHRKPFVDPVSGFTIGRGQVSLDLQLSPSRQAKAAATVPAIVSSLDLVAQFVEAHDMPVVAITGQTHAKLGAASRRYGFTAVPIKAGFMSGFLTRRVARGSGVTGDLGGMVEIYQPIDDFLKRFGHPAE